MNLVVLASGAGSNLRAIAEAIDEGRCRARIAAVVSDRPGCGALEFAEARGVATHVEALRSKGERDAWNTRLVEAVSKHDPGLVVLAGFMRILGEAFIGRFRGRIVNVHPALLPSFKGADAVAQAIAHRCHVSGCTVHVVDEGVDTGPILAQAAVPVHPHDDVESLHARIRKAEHRLLPHVIDLIARGRIELASPPRTDGAFPSVGILDGELYSPPLRHPT